MSIANVPYPAKDYSFLLCIRFLKILFKREALDMRAGGLRTGELLSLTCWRSSSLSERMVGREGKERRTESSQHGEAGRDRMGPRARPCPVVSLEGRSTSTLMKRRPPPRSPTLLCPVPSSWNRLNNNPGGAFVLSERSQEWLFAVPLPR